MTDNLDCTTYSDDACLGVDAPSLELLEFVKGEKIDLQPGRVTVLFFFNTFYKGAFGINEEFTVLFEKYGKDVNFIAINNDAEKEKLDKFLGKLAEGKIYDENTKKPQRLDVAYIAFDDKKATAKMYATASNMTIMSCPHLFIVGKDGKIAWRQQLLQSFTMNQSNFEAQLAHVLAGEPLESAGPKPKVAADEGEVAEGMAEDMSLF